MDRGRRERRRRRREGERRREIKMTSISDWGDLMERTYYLNGEKPERRESAQDEEPSRRARREGSIRECAYY